MCVCDHTNFHRIILMSQFGAGISDAFCKCLSDECLVPAVPDTREALTDYEKVLEQANDFTGYLKYITFMAEDEMGKILIGIE